MAVKMQAEYGDDLNIVFVEVQGHTMEDVQRLALEKKWFGTAAMWTKERAVITGSRGIPNFVLLSAKGEVVLKGHPMSMHKQIEEHIAAFRKGRAKAPKDLPKPLRKAYKNLAKNKYAAALIDANRVLASAVDKPELETAAKEFVGRIEASAESELARVKRAIADGFFGFAKSRYKQLAKNLKGSALEVKVTEGLKRLQAEELADEIKAESALKKIEKSLYAKGPTRATRQRLANLAKKYGGTKAGARAKDLAEFLD